MADAEKEKAEKLAAAKKRVSSRVKSVVQIHKQLTPRALYSLSN